MDLFGNLALGFSTALSPWNLLYCGFGAFLGTLIGVLPGIGPLATISLLLPLTVSLSPETSLIMLAGIYYGAQYGGSTTAILLNLPGEATSAVTAIDGHQMAKQGRAGPALAIAAVGSFIAGSIGTAFVAAFSIPLTWLALEFTSAEYFSLLILALMSAIILSSASVLNSLSMLTFGILLSLVGADRTTGTMRFTFGYFELADGISLVAVAIGLYGLAEILRNLNDRSEGPVQVSEIQGLMPTRQDMRRSAMPITRGALIGSMLGVLPGGGALLSSFASYAVERRLSRSPAEFGQGAIEGVAGPESANNASAQTSFIPMLTLGIPANGTMAVMAGALIIQGIVPGPTVATNNPELFWGVIASMWIGNLMLLILNFPLIGIWVRLIKIPYDFLFPAIIAFSALGIFSMTQNVFDIYELVMFGLAGFVLSKFGYEPTPMLLGFVLGPVIEEHLRRALSISNGDPSIFLSRPISVAFLILSVGLLITIAVPSVLRIRQQVFREKGDT